MSSLSAIGRLLPIATGSNGAVSASASLPPAVQVECKRVVSINAIAWSDECNFARVPKLVYGAARMHAGQWQALLVTEALSGFISLEQWYGTHTPDQSLRGLVMNQVASMLASLHRAGWQHGCCYPKHIFVKIAPRNTEPPVVETAILDLEKSRRRLRSKDAARHDLSQLWRHRGPIPEPDCIHLLQEHGRLLAKSCHEAGSAK